MSLSFVRCEVLRAVVTKSSIFWDTMPCSPLQVNGRFGGTCSLHFQGRRTNQVRNQAVSFLFYAGLLIGLFFDPQNGGDRFLRNFGWLLMEYTALYPRKMELFSLSFELKWNDRPPPSTETDLLDDKSGYAETQHFSRHLSCSGTWVIQKGINSIWHNKDQHPHIRVLHSDEFCKEMTYFLFWTVFHPNPQLRREIHIH
jgi:hypothetical protein